MLENFVCVDDERVIRILNNLEWLKANGSKEQLVLEFIGTPKSGKTTIAKIIERLLIRYNIPNIVLEEVEDYGSIEKTGTSIDYFIFCKRIQDAIEIKRKASGVVIFDRGLFDRLVWLEYDRLKDRIDQRQYLVFENLVKDVMAEHYSPEVFAFITSPQLCVKRKGNEGRVVNLSNMQIYNNALQNKMDFIRANAGGFLEIHTDPYEDNLDDFSVAVVLNITNRLVEILKSRLIKKQ